MSDSLAQKAAARYAVGNTLTVADVSDLIDHALLKPQLTPEAVAAGIEEIVALDAWSVCVRPSDVQLAAEITKGEHTSVCTVIGFPHGSTSTAAKVAEANQALEDGAVELDMVLGIGRLLGGHLDQVQTDIAAVVEAGHAGNALVKVIFETTLLDEQAKIAGCKVAEAAGVDFVKTSTGFAGGGATFEDVRLMRQTVSDTVQVKASGGVRDIDTLLKMLAAGATRIGASATAELVQGAKERAKAGTLVVPADDGVTSAASSEY